MPDPLLGNTDPLGVTPLPNTSPDQGSAPIMGAESPGRSFLDAGATRKAIYDRTLKQVASLKPMSNQKYTLALKDINYVDPEDFSLAEQKKAVLEGRTLARRLRGTWDLTDNLTGKSVSSKTSTLAAVPYYTNRGTFILNGSDYTLASQLRLKPGVYTRRKENSATESHFNILPGQGLSHRIGLDPESGVFHMQVGQSKLSLVPILRAMGVKDQQLREAWGNLYGANAYKADASAVGKLHARLIRGPNKATDEGGKAQQLSEALSKMPLDPEVTKSTLGAAYDHISPDVYLAATKKLLGLTRGEVEPDDRDHLAYMTVHGPEDLISERVSKDQSMLRKALWKATMKGDLSGMPTGLFTKSLQAAIMGSGLGNPSEEVNPTQVLEQMGRISRMGVGGIPCNSFDTMVLCQIGWKYWPDVTMDDELACSINGRLEFHKPIALHSADYTGDMYVGESQRLAYCVTPDHRMWTTHQSGSSKNPGNYIPWHFITASNVHGKSVKHLITAGSYTGGNDIPYMVINVNHHVQYPFDLWAEFLGTYLADGSTYYNEAKSKYSIEIAKRRSCNPDEYDFIAKLLDKLGITWTYSGDKRFNFSSKYLALYLKQFGTAHYKYVPDYIKQASPYIRRKFFDAITTMDCGGKRDGYRRYSSASQQLCEDVGFIAITLGYSVTYKTRQRKDKKKHNEYHVVIREADTGFIESRYCKNNYRTIEYNNKVYCATVPGGLLFTRYKGKTLWSGNSIDAIPSESRSVQPSHLGFVDPISTPENMRAGVDSRVSNTAIKGHDNKLYSKFIDVKTGEEKILNSGNLLNSTIAFPNELEKGGRFVAAMIGGKIKYVPREQVDYTLPSMEDAFGPISNLVPMKSAVKGQRLSMGARMSLAGNSHVQIRRADNSLYRGSIAEYDWQSGDTACSVDKTTHIVAWKPVWAKITHLNVLPMYRIKLRSGREVDATMDHSFVTMGDDGSLVKIATQDLQVGSAIPYIGHTPEIVNPELTHWSVPAGNKHNANPATDLRLDFDTGWIHGLYAAEGHICIGSTTFAALTPQIRRRVIDFFAGYHIHAMEIAGRPDKQLDRAVVNWKQFSIKLGSEFGQGSYNKRLPDWVFTAPIEYRRGLLAGYMAGDGVFAVHRAQVAVSGGSRSITLRNDLCDLCATLNIATTTYESIVNTGPKHSTVTQYTFRIRSDDVHKLPTLTHPRKDGLLRTCKWSGKRSSDWIPMYPLLRETVRKLTKRNDANRARTYANCHTRSSLQSLLGDTGESRAHRWIRSAVRWDKIEAIQELNAADYINVYDLDLEDNVFVCNGGIIVHNTTQALPLVGAETPYVQSGIPGSNNESYEELYGEHLGAIKTGPGGYVKNVTPDGIEIEGPDGKIEKHELAVNMPNNRKTMFHQTPMVKVGQLLNPGQLIARSNYTNEKGSVALGKNIKIAMVPGFGEHSNYEDAWIISEGAAKKFTSEHAYQHSVDAEEGTHFGKKTYISAFPSKYPRAILDNFDEEGVIKPGTIVQPDDPLILAVRTKDPNRSQVYRGRGPSFSDKTETWDHHTEGIVTDIAHTKDGPKVVVKTHAPAEVGDKLCLSEDHDVLTSRGWKPIATIAFDDKICCLIDGSIVYQYPVAIHRYPTGGLMYHIKSQQVDLLVTAKHRMYVQQRDNDKFELLPAESIFGAYVHYKKNGKWIGRSPKYVRLPSYSQKISRSYASVVTMCGIKLSTITFMKLLGAFLSEGYCLKNKHGQGQGIAICQTKPGGRKIFETELMPELTAAGLHCRIKSDRYVISSKALYIYFKRFGYCNEKYIPARLFNYSPRLLQHLFQWLNWGDSYSKGSRIEYYTSSQRLADDYQRLCLHLGKAANISKTDRAAWKAIKGHTYYCNDYYRVSVINNKLTPSVNYAKVFRPDRTTKQEETWIENYDRAVYCLSVPGEVFYVRRNGKPVWTGNSNRFGGKGLIADIVPDEHMPKDEEGNTIDLCFNPAGVITRTNPAAALEFALGKIAAKTGKPYKIQDFKDIDDLSKFTQDELDKHGVNDLGSVTDPQTGKVIPNVMTGNAYFMKLSHTSASKIHGRGTGGYSSDMQPSKGTGTSSAKRLALMSLNAMLSHGACVLGPSLVVTENGMLPIAQIVRERMQINVACADPVTGLIEYQPITDWLVRSVPVDDIIKLRVVARSGNIIKPARKVAITVTRGHEFYVPSGKKLAGDLVPGDTIYTAGTERRLEETTVLSTSLYRPLEAKSSFVYNLTVAKHHNYFVHGILVGNSKVIADGLLVRGQANPDYWLQFMSGYNPPNPQIPFVHQKFVNQLKASGINVIREGTKFKVQALRDSDIDELTENRSVRNPETVNWKANLAPVKGGLFDEGLTGGHGGKKWSNIPLVEPMPSPIFEEPIRRLLNLTNDKYRAILSGKEAYDGVKGPEGIQQALSKIDVPKAIEKARQDIDSGRKTQRDDAIRKLKYLKAAEADNIHPRDWIWSKVPVLPPMFRPVSVMAGNKRPMVADPNILYKELFDANVNLKEMKGQIDDVSPERLALYDALGAAVGIFDSVHPKTVERGVRGLLRDVVGDSPKHGVVQRKVLSAPVDLVGRAVITPATDLDIDSVGIPENHAWEVYKPFIIRRMIRRGVPRMAASKEVESHSDKARDAMMDEMKERPVILDRAPVLHRYGVMAFWPKLVKGDTIHLSPLVTAGFGADFDGDQMNYQVPARDEAVQEAIDKMLPSKNLFAVNNFQVHQIPSREFGAGLWLSTRPRDANDKRAPMYFATKKDAVAAYRRGDINADQPVIIVNDQT